ncbi:MAG: hypothetical protein O3C45_02415 [Bacteroidetes bacterium]|nr:hypothetical protein [Bacteroidota bacterium]
MAMAATDLDSKLARRAEKAKPKRKRRGDRKIGLPAPVVFWLVAPVGAAGIVMADMLAMAYALLMAAAP